ncbi:hypothetical protein BFJ66_g17051 [Fusarium oxysporum f. sp. cepae]|uniref:Uncharacterized protein n=1 Tax=Fusarium oxysporum f. sp. cepae TaxID=396571 RepID=A0A3L6P5B1_FUSOX|nr:hypothetical protein BFJ67_g17424 [Fusarium oxysporum f. sp. cepae]RKK26590.1 hypothetical protein BFJ66_g17051 [Fusarium oxysporum f. sp. cepae]RKK29065.1 hypothetical protein BFJ65_g1003 [Fusarium oxysporum f. sp. cepae]
MRIDAIPAWIDSVDPSSQFINTHEQITSLNTAKRRFSGYVIENPSNRKRREQPEAEAPFNADKTPQLSTTRPPNSIFDHPPLSFDVTGSTIDSFPRTLAARLHLPKSISTSRRSPSPRSDMFRGTSALGYTTTHRLIAIRVSTIQAWRMV